MNKGAVVALCLVFVGCSSARLPSVSGASLDRIRLSDTAAVAFGREEYEEALRLYEKVLESSRADEDCEGIASSLTNIAVVYRKLGRNDTARQYLSEMLRSGSASYTPLQRSKAAFLEALLCLEEGDLNHADEWATNGLRHCQESQCAMAGQLHNLQARIALAKSQPERAIAAATTALELNRDARDAVEEANSLRFAGDARLLLHECETARSIYESAYQLDMSLADSAKAALDLLKVGHAYRCQGKFTDALEYFQRARAACEEVGDAEGAETASRLIREVQTGERGE